MVDQNQDVVKVGGKLYQCPGASGGMCVIDHPSLGAVVWKGGDTYHKKCPVCGTVYSYQDGNPALGTKEAQDMLDGMSMGVEEKYTAEDYALGRNCKKGKWCFSTGDALTRRVWARSLRQTVEDGRRLLELIEKLFRENAEKGFGK